MDIGDAYSTAEQEIQDKINSRISGVDYGSGVRKWAYIATIVNFEGYGEIRRFSKRDKVAEFRLKIDHGRFKAASSQQQRKLIVSSLFRSIKMMPTLKIKDFDWPALLEDVQAVARENGWLTADEESNPDTQNSEEMGPPSAVPNGDTDPPTLITINPDDDCAKDVGRTADGRQFFLTTPFVPSGRTNPGCEFIALYLFDSEGHFLDARIDKLGARAEVDSALARALIHRRLDEIGPVRRGRIRVRPFQIQYHGTTFGLLSRPPESEGDTWWVEAQPGNYMAFHPPWDSGEYDT